MTGGDETDPFRLGDFQWFWTAGDDRLDLGRGLVDLLGWTGSGTGNALLDLVHCEDRDRHAKAVQGVLFGGPRLESALRLRCSDGRWRWIFISGAAVVRSGDHVLGVRGNVHLLSTADPVEPGAADPYADILADAWRAGVVALEQRESERNQRLAAEAATFSQREFVATISHEIRNPLSVIFASIDLLRARAEREGDAAVLDRLATLERAGKHLRDLVTDVLDLAKAEAGKIEVAFDWFDLDALLLEIEEMAMALVRGAEVMFILDAPSEAGRMHSDRLKLKQILLNLIGNAAKFTENGRITLRVSEAPGGLLFAVEDTGPGIPVDKLELLFKAFSQVGGSSTPRAGGTGLGLYISERYVRMLGGRLSVSSRAGEGSVFDFILPRVMAPASRKIPRVRGEQRLVIGHTEDLGSLDPHLQMRNTNEMIARHHFDSLTAMDAEGRLVPGLAERWEPMGAGGWRFHLRRGVRFHDGAEFDAGDVLASFERVRRLAGPYASFLRPVTDITAPDPFTLELATPAPSPLLPVDLGRIAIVHRRACDAGPEAFDAMEATIGTGPYRLKARPGERSLIFEAFADHWKGAPNWREAEFRLIDETGAASITALLAGEVDLIDNVTPEQLVELQARTDVRLSTCDTNRVWYLFFDQLRDVTPWITDADGVPLSANPLKNPLVRRAISLAIDREFITQKIMAGQARPVGDVAGPGVFGANPALRPDPYDPARAKALLAEAGHRDGFRLTLHGSRDRSFNGPTTLRAIALMLNAIGIVCRPESMAGQEYYARAAKGEFSVGLSGWGSVTGETSYSLRMLLATRDAARGFGGVNRGGWSHARFDGLVAEALGTMDDELRRRLLQEASSIAMTDVAIAPICYRTATWATKRGLAYRAQADGATLAMAAFPTPVLTT